MGLTAPPMQRVPEPSRMPVAGHFLDRYSQEFRQKLLALSWRAFVDAPKRYFLGLYDSPGNFVASKMTYGEEMIVWRCVYDERTLLRPAQGVAKGADSLLRAAEGISGVGEELLRAGE